MIALIESDEAPEPSEKRQESTEGKKPKLSPTAFGAVLISLGLASVLSLWYAFTNTSSSRTLLTTETTTEKQHEEKPQTDATPQPLLTETDISLRLWKDTRAPFTDYFLGPRAPLAHSPFPEEEQNYRIMLTPRVMRKYDSAEALIEDLGKSLERFGLDPHLVSYCAEPLRANVSIDFLQLNKDLFTKATTRAEQESALGLFSQTLRDWEKKWPI